MHGGVELASRAFRSFALMRRIGFFSQGHPSCTAHFVPRSVGPETPHWARQPRPALCPTRPPVCLTAGAALERITLAQPECVMARSFKQELVAVFGQPVAENPTQV